MVDTHISQYESYPNVAQRFDDDANVPTAQGAFVDEDLAQSDVEFAQLLRGEFDEIVYPDQLMMVHGALPWLRRTIPALVGKAAGTGRTGCTDRAQRQWSRTYLSLQPCRPTCGFVDFTKS
ncbi:MAG: hypothetical protein BVN33_09180 [Proteobacteria bacterium ST_bin13]|nr:MAG: hypothetical protein BVN33_09180 [Proteobacteria bacterium ST_bin13]